ncbi:MAG: DUF4855 domain-containing protein [Clostridia bacterium]|nr:DUF4855 domain-containing protein [Clostridia bacterium]
MLKRFITVFIILSLVLSVAPLSVFVSAGELLGDINKDGNVNAVDYALVKRAVLGTYLPDSEGLAASDINGDGEVTAIDYALIKRNVLGTYKIRELDNSIPVSYAKQYTLSVDPGSSYPDTYNCELTDSANAYSTSYTNPAFVGFSSNIDIVVDLEDDGKYLNAFAISYLSVDTAGIYIPRSVYVYGSNDNSNWSNVGNISLPSFKDNIIANAKLELSEEVDYRYIKFSVTRSAAWVFIDEIYVYANAIDATAYEASNVSNAYSSDKTTDTQRANEAANAFNGNVYDSDIGAVLISEDCSYSIDCTGYDWRCGANGSLLTDAMTTGSSFENKVWVGVSLSGGASATVDLGAVQNDICSFALHSFSRSAIGIDLPLYVDVEVSKDGVNYYTVGRSYALTSNQENYAYRLIFKKLISARYVRFTMAEGKDYCWIEELEVYANRSEAPAIENVYGEFDMIPASQSVYWDISYDYNQVQVLSSGASYEMISDVPMDMKSYGDSNTSEEAGLLTDGVTTEDLYCYNGYWNHFQSGAGRKIVIDIGKISAISSYSIRFLNRSAWGIRLPSNIKLALSENGNDWYLAESRSDISGNDESIVEFTAEFDRYYRARYILIYMTVDIHVFIDELYVNGVKNYTYGTELSSASLYKYDFSISESADKGYLDADDSVLGGAKDITLVYHNSGTINENYFLPYVAYLDENGDIKDTMFDGYLFLPSTGELPSGGRPYGTNIASDWEYLFDDIFASDRGFAALDRTAETVKKALGLSELKLKVFATIPHMDDTLSEFGDINGDFVNEDLTSLETRVFVARYYAERIVNEFEKNRYSNLELCGFYWFHEAIEGGDAETSKAVNAELDKIGYPMFWIPYYQASGFSNWQEFGFDVGCLQPNYAFSLSVDKSRLYNASKLAKRYGMCIEIEIDNSSFGDIRYFKKYMDYLSVGAELGYMDGALHMYYQGYNDFAVACRSKDDRLRLIYEYTYQFIKGTLDVCPDSNAKISVSTKKNNFCSGTVNSDSSDVGYYILSESPEHGTVSFADDGSFVYYPNKDFKGIDSFKYRISNYLGYSEECTVTVQVG